MDKSTKTQRLITGETVTSVIRILSYENGQIRSHFYNPYYNQGVFLFNELELIQSMHSWMNKLSFPQSTMQYRSLRKKVGRVKSESTWGTPVALQEVVDPDSINELKSLATFVVCVQSRQNATWQGTVQWTEQECTANFRSALELLLMIDHSLKMVSAQHCKN